jgi:hypothetical protein
MNGHAQALARAVLMFHSASQWGARERATWRQLTGDGEATTHVLCNMARRVLAEQQEQEQQGWLTLPTRMYPP